MDTLDKIKTDAMDLVFGIATMGWDDGEPEFMMKAIQDEAIGISNRVKGLWVGPAYEYGVTWGPSGKAEEV